MNRIIILSIALIISIRVGAQAPQKMSYQAVIRNNGGNGVANANVGVKISVLQASATGAAVYVEKHTTISDSNGLINLEIGGGTPLTGTFASINWANGPYFLKTETDPKGGTNYTIVGASQLLSVPYALFAANSGTPGPAGTNGLNILNGISNPTSSTGLNGEFYINTATNTLFGPKAGGTWSSGISLIGPAGILSPGNVAGNTPYWNGMSWVVNSSNIFNAGGNVGIGNSIPSAKLDILGAIKISDGSQGVGKILTSDASGLATWAIPAGSGWSLGGNSGTTNGINFIGTTDYVPLNIRVNNQPAGRIDPSGSVFLGVQAGVNYLSGNETGIGYGALFSNTIGSNNTAIGFQSLYANTIGRENTANGNQALFSNTVGFENTATGNRALYSNISGASNVAYGSNSLASNISGSSNCGFGADVLSLNTSGQFNAASGRSALGNNTTGSFNTAVGFRAIAGNSSGNNNTAIGNDALYSNSGESNTASGSSSLSSNTTGSYNTAAGFNALYSNTSGYNNTAIGRNAFSSGDSFSNSTAIGFNAQVTASNMVRLGDYNVTSINGAVAFTVVSDKRFKKDIQENVSGLPFIMKLRPVTYHLDMNTMASFMKTPDNLRAKESESAKEKVLQTGFIAQEVENAAQELGYDFSGVDKPESDSDYYGLRYAEFTVPLVKAVQEQQKMINDLQLRIQQLEEQSRSKQAALQKAEAENAVLKSDYNSRLKKLEEMVGMKAQK